ncbi:MAG: patatin-like phospholipase family protein [Candidatus Eremiobacteraeota bacterium]|nr:patatin-like phospholipase family protein [Candidatus Eremiobacteraeota bacterium]
MESTPSGAPVRPFCDLIMKGGITSGIVYPEAVYAISRVFDLKSIGGTSAGAIAAALAAAAQYRRLRDPEGQGDAGYARIRTLPDVLGASNRLLRLFAPNRSTAALFGIIVDVFAPNKPRWVKALCIVRAYPIQAALGIVPALLYGYAASAVMEPGWRIVHWVVAALVAAIGAVSASVIGLLWDALRKLPKNYYGLVTGVVDDPADRCALSTWLTAELEETAGLPLGEVPLTFGMLWHPEMAPGPCGIDDPPPSDERAVNLQMVTTCVTEGRPYQFPMRTARYYFKRDELAKFFPPHVVAWMCDHARAGAAPLEGLVPLPAIGDLPVIVATRMSLAFPVLLSAVPLYAIDYSDLPPQQPQPVWFSDGGLTSNFPIQMFDSPLPRWPTLALNLGTFGPRTPADGVIVMGSASAGRLLRFSSISGIPSFFVAMFGALQNWNDNMQTVLPGFRDRIVTIAMAPDEGGLNLSMDAATVERLRRRGADAARALIARFEAPSDLKPDAPVMSWEGHRWTRLRLEFETLGEHLARFAIAYATPHQPHDVDYAQLITADDPDAVPLRSYPLGGGAAGRAAAEALTAGTANLAGDFSATSSIANDIPRPVPSLVVRANLDR